MEENCKHAQKNVKYLIKKLLDIFHFKENVLMNYMYFWGYCCNFEI